jgi:HK97 family phage major capsid protein
VPYHPTIEDLDRERSDALARRNRLAGELTALRSQEQTQGVTERIDRTERAVANVDEFLEDLQAKREEIERQYGLIERLAQNPANIEDGDGAKGGQGVHRPRPTGIGSQATEARDAGLRTIERYRDGGDLRSDAADRLDELVRRRDPTGIDARYLEAVGDPAYNSAFGKLLADPAQGHLRFTPEEVTAVQKVSAVEHQRGLVSGVGAQGGFAIPFSLDPSVLLTSSGALNPIRDVARVIQIATREWKGISSAGVTASYDPEASEVSDDTPVLAQPTITSAMGRAFVPFSIEVGMDWQGIQHELANLISDARDVLDSTMLYSGTGTDQPSGCADRPCGRAARPHRRGGNARHR